MKPIREFEIERKQQALYLPRHNPVIELILKQHKDLYHAGTSHTVKEFSHFSCEKESFHS
ncbi:hypothetical protein LOAG_18962 [Loa loa]|uniref:Uncharacterized protein n=1 Tax=Loa loa TaxID=7209 RepID=A0A1S0UD90_LOALO|nr:hypothetical protein LOAG_18962 [Loa loa]EJD73622.1 hypothetical protein LOAG_18962 [Loa loa]